MLEPEQKLPRELHADTAGKGVSHGTVLAGRAWRERGGWGGSQAIVKEAKNKAPREDREGSSEKGWVLGDGDSILLSKRQL